MPQVTINPMIAADAIAIAGLLKHWLPQCMVFILEKDSGVQITLTWREAPAEFVDTWTERDVKLWIAGWEEARRLTRGGEVTTIPSRILDSHNPTATS